MVRVDLNLQYVAGLFDGDGTFTLRRSKPNSRKQTVREFLFVGSASLGLREKFVVDSLKERFGGSITRKPPKQVGHATVWIWSVSGFKLDSFLEQLDGKLICKQKQLKVMLTFRGLKLETGNKPITDESYSKQVVLREDMRVLNQLGVDKT